MNVDKLRSDATAARTAADASADAREPKDKQRKLAAKACDLEEQLRFADWKQLQEDAGFTVEGDTFDTATVAELPDGPTYDVTAAG